MGRVLEILPGILLPVSEITFRFSRSGGPGGQNVNKVETRVEAGFPVGRSQMLDGEVREQLLSRLGRRLDDDGWLRVTVNESRSQFRNRELAVARIAAILRNALRHRKVRKPTRPTAASRLKKAGRKRHLSEKKRGRASARFVEDE